MIIRRLRASMTVEAAVVVPVALIAVAGMIITGYRLHDIVLGNMAANEAAELYNYLPEEKENEKSIEAYGESRLENVLSDIRYSLKLEKYRDGSRAELRSNKGDRVLEAPGSRPEKLMRRLTLLEAFENE